MILTYGNKILLAVCVAVLISFSGISVALAQSSVSLSVTPTLFNLSVTPGQAWRSSVRVVNPNAFELAVFTTVANFAPQGEYGTGAFLPVLETETQGRTLAEWITIDSESVTIPPESSVEVPITVSVPVDAAPGGHFAAILVSTVPPEPGPGQVRVRTAQIVSSLFFMRVAGDVVERGSIREFTSSAGLVQRPTIDFLLRFENEGNVHLQPQGDITIFNMWGQERGRIPINYQTHYGNVLPESIRQFSFTWTGETAWFDIGRYRAMATLGYGTDARRFVTSTTYFWVVPYTQLAIAAGIVLSVILIVVWLVRRYVRSMLRLAGVDPDQPVPTFDQATLRVGSSRYRTATAPLRVGVVDVRRQLNETSAFTDTIRVLARSVVTYRLFVFGVGLCILSIVLLSMFYRVVTKEERAFEVSINNPDSRVVISSEELAYDALRAEQGGVVAPERASSTAIELVNVSGVSGAAAAVRLTLEGDGFRVVGLRSDLERVSERTVLVYSPEPAVQAEALEISSVLGGIPISAAPAATSSETGITIFVGSDMLPD